MKIPHKVRIKPKVSYSIVWVDRFDDPTVMGMCHPDLKQIHIKNGMSKAATLKTFIHELLHAIEFAYEIKIEHKTIYSLEDPLFYIFAYNASIDSLIKSLAPTKSKKAIAKKRGLSL